jgi:uncharacterized coiled-coil protein SlyX
MAIYDRNFEAVRQKLEEMTSKSFEQDKKIQQLQEQIAMMRVEMQSMSQTVNIFRARFAGNGPSV